MKLARRDFILLGFIIYFTFIGGTFYSQLNFFLRVVNQLFVTILLMVWLIIKLKNRQGLPKTALDLPIAFYLVINFLSAVLGLLPRYSLELMWFSVVHVLAFYLLVDLMRRGYIPKLVWAFFMTAAVVCLVGLTEFLAWYFGTPLFASFSQGWAEIGGWQQPLPPRIYRLNITLNGSTPLAAYLALLIPPALGLVLSLPRRSENRQALFLWLGLAFSVEILTFSRAGVLALMTSVPLLFVIRYWLQVNKQFSWWAEVSTLLKRPKFILTLIIIAGAGSGWLYRSFSNRAYSTNFRFTLWEAAGQIFQQHWLTGAGPANFGRALLQLNNPDFPRHQIATAHSIYFNTAAELGLLGLLAGGALMLTVAWLWWQRWQEASNQADKIRVTAVGAALTGLAMQTLVDTYAATPNMLVMLALVAWLSMSQKKYFRHPISAHLAFGGVLIYAGWFVILARADFHFQRSFNWEKTGNLTEAISEAAIARQIDPAFPLRTFRLARLEAILAHQNDDATLLQTAIDRYRWGLQQEPILGLNSANLAGLLWQASQPDEAIATLEQAIAVEPDPLYLVNLGYLYEQQNNWPEAEIAYGRALAQKPQLAGSDFWRATENRAARWPKIERAALAQVADAPDRSQWVVVNLALARGNFDRIQNQIATPDLQARVYLEQGQLAQAEALLTAQPEDWEDFLLWGWLKYQQGDDASAEQSLKTAAFSGNREAHYYLGQMYERQGDFMAAETAYRRGFSPRSISENIAVNIYDRRGGNDLAPQLLKIGAGERQAQAWLALARLYEQQQRFDDAAQLYRFLLTEDPFFQVASERLAALSP